MLELVHRLKAIGENIKNEHVVVLLLVSVPQSYDHLITALEAQPNLNKHPNLSRTN